MRAVVYDTDTGTIRRSMRGAIRLENQRLADDEAIAWIADDAQIIGKLIDPDTEELVNDPDYTPPPPLNRHVAFLDAGASALDHRDAIAANDNIPQEVVDLADDQLRMLYLIYVHLAGDANRIDGFEDRFFQ